MCVHDLLAFANMMMNTLKTNAKTINPEIYLEAGRDGDAFSLVAK